jgi:hypothetical protein
MDGYDGVYGDRPYDMDSVRRDVWFINNRHHEFIKTINIYNVSPQSKVECFKKITIKSAVEVLK